MPNISWLDAFKIRRRLILLIVGETCASEKELKYLVALIDGVIIRYHFNFQTTITTTLIYVILRQVVNEIIDGTLHFKRIV